MLPRLLAALLVACALVAPPTAVADPGVPAPASLWALPLEGEPTMTRGFEAPPHPYGAGHRGVDLAAAVGAPVLAAGGGTVAFAGMVAGRPVVSVDHPNGLRTTYEPVDPSVGAGQAVARGSPIGMLTSGHAGCPAAACLHWGLRRGDTYLDPMALLRPPRIRLLPVETTPRSGRRSGSGRRRHGSASRTGTAQAAVPPGRRMRLAATTR